MLQFPVPSKYLVRLESTVVMGSLLQDSRRRMNMIFFASRFHVLRRVSFLGAWIPCENLCEKILPKYAKIGESCLRSAKDNSRSFCSLREMRRL